MHLALLRPVLKRTTFFFLVTNPRVQPDSIYKLNIYLVNDFDGIYLASFKRRTKFILGRFLSDDCGLG
jgi:hypothetical protein